VLVTKAGNMREKVMSKVKST